MDVEAAGCHIDAAATQEQPANVSEEHAQEHPLTRGFSDGLEVGPSREPRFHSSVDRGSSILKSVPSHGTLFYE